MNNELKENFEQIIRNELNDLFCDHEMTPVEQQMFIEKEFSRLVYLIESKMQNNIYELFSEARET